MTFVKFAAFFILIILISSKANRNVGKVKLESQTDEYLKEINIDFNFPLHNFITMDDPDFQQKVGEGIWNQKKSEARRVLGSRKLQDVEATVISTTEIAALTSDTELNTATI